MKNSKSAYELIIHAFTHTHTHLLVEFKPGGKAFGVLVLQSEEPNLPQTDGFHHL